MIFEPFSKEKRVPVRSIVASLLLTPGLREIAKVVSLRSASIVFGSNLSFNNWYRLLSPVATKDLVSGLRLMNFATLPFEFTL